MFKILLSRLVLEKMAFKVNATLLKMIEIASQQIFTAVVGCCTTF